MIGVINKIGSNKEVINALRSEGWKGKYTCFAMQKQRGRLTAEVMQKLWSYCEKNGIKVKPEDFKGE